MRVNNARGVMYQAYRHATDKQLIHYISPPEAEDRGTTPRIYVLRLPNFRKAVIVRIIKIYSNLHPMKTIRSKKHILNYYLAIIFTSLFCIAIALIIFWGITVLVRSDFQIKKIAVLIIMLLMFIAIVNNLISYLKYTPLVTINEQHICVKKEQYRLEDIIHIDLTGKMPYGKKGAIRKEGMAIEFNTGEKVYLFDEMYSNLWQIKLFLEQVAIEKQPYKEPRKFVHNPDSVYVGEVAFFDRNQFMSVIGIAAWSFSVFYLLIALIPNNNFWWVAIWTTVALAFFILFSSAMHYFEISEQYLRVRCHNLFWIKRLYKLDDIRQVVFEKHRGSTRGIRIITNDFKMKIYRASTLKANTWIEMKEMLESKGVPIRR